MKKWLVLTLFFLLAACAVAQARPTATQVFLPEVLRQATSDFKPRPWPDTTSGIHVFNDQLPGSMSQTLLQFSATRYAGTQKMTRSTADQLRAINPDFLILHYRLGPGLGYRGIQNGCQPTGDWLAIVEGNTWVQEWPGDGVVQENWFFHWPESGSTRVLQCDWGWYLMDLSSSAYRTWWQAEVLRQLRANDDDGLFLDSLSVPNYLGGSSYNPNLPDLDTVFESAWAQRIHNWLDWLQTQPAGDYYIVPNVGSWITTRDPTDYSPVDGVMIEGFALEGDASPYALVDWQLQMNRILSLVTTGKAVINQTYAYGDRERMFALGSYLLIKGNRTYFNLELDYAPEWWPEYDLPIGSPTQNAGTAITNLRLASGLYRRSFSNGFVLVNPTNPWDGSGQTIPINLGGTYYLAQTSGGGEVPESGIPTGVITYQAVTSLNLPPYSAAVLFNTHP
ncbi:MAG TPA: putative glycoside hydrolase [Anaerolineaceae bacterium]|nr:putative glycoside hydrolase [Anaerolineaceae bacterium]HPN53119.1 putative glycoside hydrolase [Anaerolineaceae bacterium]